MSKPSLPLINFTHICDNAFLSQGGKLNIIGIFQSIYTKKIPFLHPRITCVLNCNITKQSALKIQIVHGSSKELISKISGNLAPKEPAKGTHIQIGFMSDFQNIRFEHSGLHLIEIWIDGKLEQTIPFQIKVME